MRDYWLTQGWLQAAGLGYVLFATLAVVAAAWLPKGWKAKTLAVVVVLGLASILPIQSMRELAQRRQENEAAKTRFAKAKSLFDEHCRGAGETIGKTVENVDGILLINVRPRRTNANEQFVMDDPYGRDCSGGDDCIGAYLFGYRMVPVGRDGQAGLAPQRERLYRFVDADDASGKRYRYTKDSAQSPLRKASPSDARPRYGVLWEDISTRADREYWIAGGSLKVIDLSTNEVIAERRGYLIDPGQGDTAGDRSPWDWARSHTNACPSVAEHNQQFVAKVLRPTSGEK